jgi:uncharacterized protein (DUF2141 family)
MKKYLSVFLPILLLIFYKNAPAQSVLEIEIAGIKSNDGVIMLQLFDENQKVLRQEQGAIMGKKCIIILKDLKPGKYAVRYFHDENLSGELETNKMGIPIEGYGFSNNATGMFGPPSFDKWLFELKDNMRLLLKPGY